MRAFLLSILLLVTGPAFAGGIEAIQLDYVANDVSLKCDRIFFRSTQHFKGTIFALPRVIPDVDDHFEDLVRIVKNPKDTPGKPYILGFSIYFPRDDEEIKSKTTFDEAAKFKACDFERVKNYHNKINPDDPIHTVASMPITSFTISLPDFVVTEKLVFNDEEKSNEDIIDYQGKTFDFTYEITEKEMRAIKEAPNGIQARVRFKFQARRRDGSLSIQLSTDELATNFEAHLHAQDKTKIAKGEIEAAVRVALKATNLSINTQEGSAEFSGIAGKIIDQVLAGLNFNIKDVVPGEPAKLEDSDAQIDVKIVAEVIRSKVDSNIEYNNVKAAEEASAETTVQLEPSQLDPNVIQLRVAAGEGDAVLNRAILRGDTVTITPAYYSELEFQYQEKVSYLTEQQIKSDEYSRFFRQMLTSGRWNIENQNRSGFDVGVVTPTIMSAPKDYFLTEYAWRRVERLRVVSANPRTTMGTTPEDFDRFPVTVAFSNVGGQRRRFAFNELIGTNDYWTAHYDKFLGSIVLTANQDLGTLVLKERFLLNEGNNDKMANASEKDESDFRRDPVVTEELIREKRTTWTDIEDSKPEAVRRNGKAEYKKRVVFYNLTYKPATKQQEEKNEN